MSYKSRPIDRVSDKQIDARKPLEDRHNSVLDVAESLGVSPGTPGIGALGERETELIE